MIKTKILFLGYSSFVRRRVISALKKNKKIEYCICSKSNKKNIKNKIYYNTFDKALTKFEPDIVYISKINSLHYKFAKIILKRGYNVIVDKPVTLKLKYTKELLKIAKTKKLFFAEAVLFNYHRVFEVIEKICGGFKNVTHIHSNFNIPFSKNPSQIRKIQGDCESDMSPYAAAIIRLFLNGKIKKINIYKDYYQKTKLVKNFYITTKSKQSSYFGNFAFQREYDQEIIFYTKDKIISSPKRIFALPPGKNTKIILKTRNKVKEIKVKKDDCIENFFNLVLNKVKNNNYSFFYEKILKDAKIRNTIKKFN
jgi:predicted dehydrogenase